jgi:hypothetical protein
MSVLLSDIRYYGSANMPESDGATVGGAIDFSKRVEFEGTAMTPTLFDVVSSSASDVATKITYQGLDSTGVSQSETLTLNGQTKVAGSKSLELLLAGATSGGAIAGIANPGGTQAVGDVALISHTLVISAHTMQSGSAQATTSNPAVAKLQAGDGAACAVGMVLRTTGGTGPNQIRRILAINPNGLGADFVAIDRNWGTLPDNTTTYEVGHGFHFELTGSSQGVALAGTSTQVLAITRLFNTAAADVSSGSTRTYYDKFFVCNNNLTTAVTTAQLEILSNSPALPSGATLDLGLATGYNDSLTIANRQTAPAGVSFTTQPALINAPAPQYLAASSGAGSATGVLGMWARLTLAAGTAAYEGVSTVRTTGNTT